MSETKNPNIVTNRHDFLLLFEVTNGNPNGDPDAGNMPRLDPNTSRGLVSDVCLKRKIRNYVQELSRPRDSKPNEDSSRNNGYSLFVRQGAVLNDEIGKGIAAAEQVVGKDAAKDKKSEEAMKWLCREFYDVRTMGAVLATGAKDSKREEPMKGSAWGQVRGPVQFTFGQSFHPITPLEITVTRCAVTKPEDKAKERTMGHKYIVPYALYAAKGYVSPAFAERTGFSNEDLTLLFNALLDMFENDRSAARGEMIVRGLYDFEHVGTQHENNTAQNKKEARLGCAHAHVLFEGIEVRLKKNPDGTTKEAPQSFADYEIINHWNPNEPAKGKKDSDGKEYFRNLTLPKGVRLHLRHGNPIQTIPSAS